MTLPETNEALGRLIRSVVNGVRAIGAKDVPTDPVDRALAAAALLAGAVVVAWPAGRKAPQALTGAVVIARHVWRRRSWFTPTP